MRGAAAAVDASVPGEAETRLSLGFQGDGVRGYARAGSTVFNKPLQSAPLGPVDVVADAYRPAREWMFVMEAAITVTLIGLVRVTGDARDVERQHELLGPICARVLEEKASRRRLIKNRPQLMAALDHLRPGDRHCPAW